MTMPNIALTGALRSGKSEVARYLTERYGYTEFAFGDELKRMAAEIFPDEFRDGRKPRELLQWFGQTMRQRDPDVWGRKCFETIREVGWEERTVISDLRQPNEFDRCRSEGYVIIRIKAQSALRIHRAVESADTFNLGDLSHETEQHTDGFDVDYEITNDGTLAELYTKIDGVMAEINAKRVTQ